MKVLSLFDGISCARAALDRAGKKTTAYYASEIDGNAIQISQKNYPDIIHIGDVKSVKNYGHRKIDLIIGGSPCQDLSIANKNRKGLKGKRSGLFWEFVRILKETKPKYFILENVASMPQEVKDEITKVLGVEPIPFDAALVSAQVRRRLFWTNILGIKLPKDKGTLLKDILQKKLPLKPLRPFTSRRIAGWKEDDLHIWAYNSNKSKSQISEHVYFKGNSKAPTLTCRGEIKYYQPDFIRALPDGRAIVKEATKKGYAYIEDGDSVDISFPSSKTRRGRVGKRVKTLMTSSSIAVYTKGGIRMLTPVECERLQCLPDGYTGGVSDAQRRKCLGNAFNVNVLAHIISYAK